MVAVFVVVVGPDDAIVPIPFEDGIEDGMSCCGWGIRCEDLVDTFRRSKLGYPKSVGVVPNEQSDANTEQSYRL